MDRKSIIYIGIASIFCLTVFYYFYRSPSHLPSEDVKNHLLEESKYPSFTLSRGALEQASRVPKDQDEDEEEESELDIESFFDGWTIQRNGLGDVMSVSSDDREKNLPLPDAESQTASVLLLAQEMAPLFGGRANQVGGSSVTGTNFVKHYSFQQIIDSYEVYGGKLRVSVLQDNQSVFSVINSLKEINMEDFNTNLNYDREQAWDECLKNERCLQKEALSPTTQITQINTEKHRSPQLFVRVENPVQELAWVFDVKLEGNQSDVMRVVVGGVSGERLVKRSTLTY